MGWALVGTLLTQASASAMTTYALSHRLFAAEQALFELHPETHSGVLIGDLDIAPTDLVATPTGQLLAWAPGPTPGIYAIDPGDASTSFVGPTPAGVEITDLWIGAGGELWGSDVEISFQRADGLFYSLDPGAGTAELEGTLACNTPGMVFCPVALWVDAQSRMLWLDDHNVMTLFQGTQGFGTDPVNVLSGGFESRQSEFVETAIGLDGEPWLIDHPAFLYTATVGSVVNNTPNLVQYSDVRAPIAAYFHNGNEHYWDRPIHGLAFLPEPTTGLLLLAGLLTFSGLAPRARGTRNR